MRRDSVVAGVLLLFGLCLALPFALSGPRWYTDSLYYEAQKLEVMGTPQPAALEEVFSGPLARPLRGRLPSPARLPEYARFYRRRWLVPVIAAGLTPALGTDSLRDASLLGWAILAPLLFALLRRWFSRRASAIAAVLTMFLPPLLMWAPAPLVDSWGASMLVAGLLTGFLAGRDTRWLPAWFAVVLAGSFTRDLGLILVLATGWLALVERSRRMALVAGVGVLASAPAPLIFSAPLRQNLAYIVNGFSLPDHHVGWGWILARYPHAVLSTLTSDLSYPFRVGSPYSILAFAFAIPAIAGLWLLFRSPRSPFLTLIRGATVAAFTSVLLSPNYTELRLELAFIPAIATGLALVVERVSDRGVRPLSLLEGRIRLWRGLEGGERASESATLMYMSDSVGVAELRQNLSVYLRRVRQGERLIVTDRNRPVAELGPAPSTGPDLDRLIAEGRVSRPLRARFPEPLELGADPAALSAALEDIRGDR